MNFILEEWRKEGAYIDKDTIELILDLDLKFLELKGIVTYMNNLKILTIIKYIYKRDISISTNISFSIYINLNSFLKLIIYYISTSYFLHNNPLISSWLTELSISSFCSSVKSGIEKSFIWFFARYIYPLE